MDQLTPFDPKDFPLKIEWDFYSPVKKADWDLDNMMFYWKYLQDTLVDCGIIPDDTVVYITHPPSPRWFPVEDWKDRRFEFRITSDNRKIITNHHKKKNLL